MQNIDSISHVRGKSVYLDDIPELRGTLHGLIFDSPCAHGIIKNIDYSNAEKLPGVIKIITHNGIPGQNQIGGILPDEPLLAETEIHFCGQPIAIIIAESQKIAAKARKLISISVDELPVIVDPRKAKDQNKLIMPPRTFKLGDTKNKWQNCEFVFEGTANTNGQEHLYIETQGAYALPMENGSIRLYSSTQGPTSVQRIAARVLGISMHKIEVDVTRLGGGFGGKEDQATPWAVMAALGCKLLNLPVKISLSRSDDMRFTGKRHPYSSDYKIGLSKDFKIIAYEATFFQNAGAAADLSPAVLERTLFHATNSYFIPNVELTAYSCKTNLPPNTAFRGFGGPQGMYVIEAAIAHAAHALNIPAAEIQEKNLLQNGDEFPYGQIAQNVEIGNTWNTAKIKFELKKLEDEIAFFNNENTHFKKGFSMMPISFGISFTKTVMNHARALVHIYQDGSVGISTGAVEMGQGVNTKMMQVAASVFGINHDKIKIETTNTTRVANTSPTAASATADLNGKALEIACLALVERLKTIASEHLNISCSNIILQNEFVFNNKTKTDLSWQKLIETAFLNRVCLSENGHYSTPEIHFNKEIEKGHPFAYHVYGTAITVVTVDCIRGRYQIDALKIVHDFGKSMNPIIDIGQVEGAAVQGIGWMTMEEIIYNQKGKLISNTLSNYKIPDIYSAPKELLIEQLETEGHEMAIKKSKAVGEPPLMYGIGAYFAIQNAVKAFNKNHKIKFDAPFTPEKVLMGLYEK